MGPTRVSEEELVRGAQRGDPLAFRGLVELYGTLTERTARVLLADRADAEDAVQEAWLDAWRGLHSFQVGRPFRPWLVAIVGNRCRMLARTLKPPAAPYDETAHESLPALQVLPFESSRDYSLLQSALDSLDEHHRQVLALRFFADLQLYEIAELLGVPVGTVKSRLHRALQSLRVLLQEGTQLEKGKR